MKNDKSDPPLEIVWKNPGPLSLEAKRLYLESVILRDKIMDNILKIIPNDKQNNPFCGYKLLFGLFGHHCLKSSNQNSIKALKVIELTNKIKWL